ncbi:unnamed protein product [Euphydryas editha]|uniref:DUF4817 domain-containing protein n=1 Tax=Euphydryas editha TaxID=104508 RepID=A0AAU9UF43_EUPED|nr:unnamed protein product [Euphydryas editha]
MAQLSDFLPAHFGDIYYYYGLKLGSARAACTAYLAAFPNRCSVPSARNFQELHRRLALTGLGLTRDSRESGVIIDLSIEEAILDDLFAEPTTSTRYLALRHIVSQKSVWRILRRAGYYYQRVQNLHEDVDWRPRCVICPLGFKKIRENPEFMKLFCGQMKLSSCSIVIIYISGAQKVKTLS